MLKSKRIVFFCGTLMQGGAERVISILSRRMKEMGYSVQILLFYDRTIHYEIDSDIRLTIVEKDCKGKNIIQRMLWIRRFLKENADILISFLAPFNIFALVTHAGLKSKIIVADRNDPRHVPDKLFIRKLRDFLYRFADGVVVQTTHNQKYFSKAVQKKSKVIHNPVDLGEKAGMALYAEKKHEIVSVGRLMPQKNQIMLLNAFAKIKDEFPEYVLTIYGDGPERERLLEKARELGVQDRFFLPGNVKDVFDRISASELFVLSSDYEGMPNALIEAMCLGLPCISTLVSGVDDLITEEVSGNIIPVGDTEELVESMRCLLSDYELRDMYAVNATKINDKLKIDIIAQRWIDLLKNIFVMSGDNNEA